MAGARLKKTENKAFFWKGWKEKAKAEIKDALISGEHRKELSVILGYYLFLIILVLSFGWITGLPSRNLKNIGFIFLLIGVYAIISDFFKRKKIISQSVSFFIDSFCHITLITVIVLLAGGHESPVKIPLFFLVTVFAPIFGTWRQLLFSQILILFLFVGAGLFYHGGMVHLVISFLEGLTLLTAAVIIKISTALYQKKSNDYSMLRMEQEVLYKESQEYNVKLEMTVAEKTAKLRKLLDSAESEKLNLERQRIATANLLEDMAETQEKLRISKTSLEIKQLELTAIAELNIKLTSVMDIDDLIVVIREYLTKFIDFNVFTILIHNIEGREEIILKSEIMRPVSRRLLDLAKSEISGFLLNYKVVSEEENNKIMQTEVEISQGKLIEADEKEQYTNFILPFKNGDRIYGAIHIASENAEVYKEKEKKSVVEAIISSVSGALASLEKMYKLQQSKTESLVGSLSNGIIMLNKSREVVLVNPAATRFTGVDKNGFGFGEFLDILAEEDLDEMIEKAMIKGEGNIIKETMIGQKYYEIYVISVKNPDNKIVGAGLVIHDITQLKVVDQMKSEFVSVASHQLRTPLTAVRLFIEMLLNGDAGEIKGQQKEYLNNVYKSTDRMIRLVNDLLNISRIESNRMRIDPMPAQLEKLIKSVVDEERPLAELKRCSIGFMAPPEETPEVPIDKNLFRQVVHNLVTNAVKYSNAGGKVDVSLKLQNGDYLIEVADKGIGIPKKFQARIFEKFSRADNAVKTETEGTGLGLYVCKKIVDTFDGKIWFETSDNQGTKFFVLLPKTGMKANAGERGLVIS